MSETYANRPPVPPEESEARDYVLPPPRCAVDVRVAGPYDAALLDAAQDGDMKKLHALLDLGADINARNQFDNTALHLAATGNHVEAARFLRAQDGIDEEVVNRFGNRPRDCAKTPGMKAVFAESRKIPGIRPATVLPEVRPTDDLLVQKDKNGKYIPLAFVAMLMLASFAVMAVCLLGGVMAAVGGGGLVSAKILAVALGSGAVFGKTLAAAAEAAERLARREKAMEKIDELTDTIRQFRNNALQSQLGRGVNPSGYEGNIPLHWAIQAGNADAVKELLAYGADPNAKDGEGNTPTLCALRKKNAAMVKALRAHPATRLDIPNNDGQRACDYMHLIGEEEAPLAPAQSYSGSGAWTKGKSLPPPSPAPKP